MRTLLFTIVLMFSLTGCAWIKSLGPEREFFCKINGEKFKPERDSSPFGSGGGGTLEAKWNMQTKVLSIYARNSPKEINIYLVFDSNTIVEKRLEFGQDASSSVGFFLPDNSYYIPINEDIRSYKGSASITNVEGNKIWGTFEFVCRDSVSKKEYRITEGEFNNLSHY